MADKKVTSVEHRQLRQPNIPSGEKTTDSNTILLKTQLEQLQSSEQGLTSEEAHKRLGTYGPNETTGTKRESGVVQFLRLFLNPLIIVLLSNILNFVQTYRSQKAVDQLRSRVATTATALRDGTWIEIQSRDLVPGDMIRLTAGAMVPADARLVQTTDLQVQQAALTGESQPAEKTADDLAVPTENLAETHNRVFLGTSVVSGARLPQSSQPRAATPLLEISQQVWPRVRRRPSSNVAWPILASSL